jgi:hypothetical protein
MVNYCGYLFYRISEGYACLTGYYFLVGYLFGTVSGVVGFCADWLLEPIGLSAGMESNQKEKIYICEIIELIICQY